MKLICELCGGDLQMKTGGQSACCTNCGLEYSKERLMEMLKCGTQADPDPVEEPVRKLQVRNLYLKRKFNLSGCAAKAAFYLDGQLCAVLTARGEACVPVSEGEHEISVRIGVFVLESLKFTVTDRDLCGLLYLSQKAITAEWVFEVSQL